MTTLMMDSTFETQIIALFESPNRDFHRINIGSFSGRQLSKVKKVQQYYVIVNVSPNFKVQTRIGQETHSN
jgi:hypothetical protein